MSEPIHDDKFYDEDAVVQMARDYLSMKRRLVTGEEIVALCRAVVDAFAVLRVGAKAAALPSAGVARIECSNCGAKYERYEAPCPHCSFSAVPSATTPRIRCMRPCARHEGIPFTFTAYADSVATYCPHCEAESAA